MMMMRRRRRRMMRRLIFCYCHSIGCFHRQLVSSFREVEGFITLSDGLLSFLGKLMGCLVVIRKRVFSFWNLCKMNRDLCESYVFWLGSRTFNCEWNLLLLRLEFWAFLSCYSGDIDLVAFLKHWIVWILIPFCCISCHSHWFHISFLVNLYCLHFLIYMWLS